MEGARSPPEIRLVRHHQIAGPAECAGGPANCRGDRETTRTQTNGRHDSDVRGSRKMASGVEKYKQGLLRQLPCSDQAESESYHPTPARMDEPIAG